MKLILSIFISSVLLISCNSERSKKEIVNKIKGDWINDTCFYSFTESQLTNFTQNGNYKKEDFSIIDDSIVIHDNKFQNSNPKYYLYYSTQDTLKMFFYNNGQKNKLLLYKSNKASTDSIVIISGQLFSSFCFGTCPAFMVKINSDRAIEYTGFGGDNVKLIGLYQGTITNDQVNILRSLISRIDEDKLFISDAIALDVPTSDLVIKFIKYKSCQVIQYHSLFHSTIELKSHELTLFYNFLQNIYKETLLVKKKESFENKNQANLDYYYNKYYKEIVTNPLLNKTVRRARIIKY